MLDVGEQSVESGNVGKTKCIFFPHCWIRHLVARSPPAAI